MTLEEFVDAKIKELSHTYRDVKLHSLDKVLLNENSVVHEFMVTQTSLEQLGKEVKLSDLPKVRTIPFYHNGTVVKYDVKAPRKRKYTSLEFYFLWTK